MKTHKILYITDVFPYPPYSGGRIKTLNTIKTLARRYEIDVLCQTDKWGDLDLSKEISAKRVHYHCFYNPDIGKKLSLFKTFKRLSSLTPHSVTLFQNKALKDFIARGVQQKNYTVIHIDHLYLAQFLPSQKQHLWIYEEHNIEHELYSTFMAYEPSLCLKVSKHIETFFMYRYEKRYINRFDHIFAISTRDKHILVNEFHAQSISVQRIYYPIQHNTSSAVSKNIIFIGSLFWSPNKEAVAWFCKEIAPLVLNYNKQAIFHFIGHVDDAFKSMFSTKKNIFHNFVPDIHPHLNNANVFILPFRTGSGIRVKALTSLAYGIPLVSTQIGIQGIKLRHSQECLITDDAKTFAKYIATLLSNTELKQRLASNGKKFLQTYHSRKVNTYFMRQYDRVVN